MKSSVSCGRGMLGSVSCGRGMLGSVSCGRGMLGSVSCGREMLGSVSGETPSISPHICFLCFLFSPLFSPTFFPLAPFHPLTRYFPLLPSLFSLSFLLTRVLISLSSLPHLFLCFMLPLIVPLSSFCHSHIPYSIYLIYLSHTLSASHLSALRSSLSLLPLLYIYACTQFPPPPPHPPPPTPPPLFSISSHCSPNLPLSP